MTTATRNPLTTRIRWMVRRDMPDVTAIEAASFDSPWSEDDLCRCMRQRNCIGMVAEVTYDRVVAFFLYELNRHHLHLLNFAVAPDARRRGVGRQMAAKLVDKLESQRRSRLTLAVGERNLPAQMFFASVGFKATSVLRGYYAESGEDAYAMEYRLGGKGAASLPADRLALYEEPR